MVRDKIFCGARSASQKILSRDNANEDLWQTNKHTDRQGWNSITPFLQSRGNIKHMQLSQKGLEILLNCRDSFIYLYVDIHTSLKWRIALFLIPWMHLKRLIWKKKLKRKTKTAGISIHVIKTTGKLRVSIQIFFLLCPAQSIEWICTSWCFSYVLITQIHFFCPCIIRFFWAYNKTKTYYIVSYSYYVSKKYNLVRIVDEPVTFKAAWSDFT